MKRILTVLSLFVISIGATNSATSAKGMRAILVCGGNGEGQQVLAEFDEALTVYTTLMRGMLRPYGAEEITRAKNRSCLGIAAILLNENTRNLPADVLSPDMTRLQYWYYPALNGEPALSMLGHLMDPELEKLLPRYDEEFLKRTEYPRCPFPRR